MVALQQDGKLRMLGVTTAKRSPMLPDLPAIGETLPGYDVTGWYALFVPRQDAEGHHPEDVYGRQSCGGRPGHPQAA